MNKSKNLTLKDIARLSGVGKSTVSLVINKSPKVKQSTRDKVEAVIQEHGYTPSLTARALRSQREKIIGIIMTRLDSTAENSAIRTMLAAAYQNGYDAILQESMFDSELLEEHLHVLESRRVEGIILFGFSGMESVNLDKWKNRLVIIASKRAGFASVNYDDHGAVALLMKYLYENRVKNVSFIGVHETDKTTGAYRHKAYTTFCEKYGFKPNALLGDLSYQSGYELAEKLVTAETEALICATDTIALGAMKSLKERGLNVQVTSIGDIPLLKFLNPEVITVHLGFSTAGKHALELLLAMHADKNAIKQIIVPCSFST